jgi:hypothetical protein
VQQLKTTVVLWGKRVASSTQALLYAEALTYIIKPEGVTRKLKA